MIFKKRKKKNHRRAFTLIELLAVILILGIIALIAIPNINNTIQVARKKSFAVEVEIIKREAEKQYMADILLGKGNSLYCNMELEGFDCSGLDINKKSQKYLVELDKNGHAQSVYLSDGRYCYANTSLVTTDEVTFDYIEEGSLDCSSGTCICFNSKGQGKVTVVVNNGQSSGNSVIVKKGEDSSFEITPDDGYSLEDAEITGGCVLEGNKLILKEVSGSNTCNVTLKKQKYSVTLNCSYCTEMTQTKKVEIGSSSTFTIVPASGYKLDDATVEGSGCTLSDNKVTFSNVTGTRSCSVSLTKQLHTISTTCNGCTANPKNATVEHGTSKSFDLTASTGYTLTDAAVSGTGCSIVGSTLIAANVTNDVNCTVTLPKQKYAVNTSCSGCTSLPSSANVEHGSSATFTITPAKNYTLTGATVSGTGCSLNGTTLTVSNVTSARTCTVTAKASWKCAEGTLTADSSKGASSGGYVCVRNATSQTSGGHCKGLSCATYVYDHSYCASKAFNSCDTVDCYSSSCGGYYGYCNIDGDKNWCQVDVSYGQNCTCTGGYIEGETTYSCPSGWTTYSGSGSSLKCYKAATQ